MHFSDNWENKIKQITWNAIVKMGYFHSETSGYHLLAEIPLFNKTCE